MSYTLLRIDYNQGEICAKCHRKLISAKVIVAEDDQGDICYLGSECAKHARNTSQDIPNLTREFSVSQGGNNIPLDTSLNGEIRRKNKALAYLLLRQKSLASFKYKGLSYVPFSKILEKYFEGYLDDGDIRYISNVMKKNDKERPFFSLLNLKNLYLLDFFLTKALVNVDADKQDFLANIQNTLRRSAYLTNKQIIAVSHWFEHIDGVKKDDITRIELVKP